MKSMIHAWNWLRVLRLLAGAGALVMGILQKESLVVIAGILILVGAIFNIGCCGAGGCSIPSSTRKKGKMIDYEELGDSK